MMHKRTWLEGKGNQVLAYTFALLMFLACIGFAAQVVRSQRSEAQVVLGILSFLFFCLSVSCLWEGLPGRVKNGWRRRLRYVNSPIQRR